MSEVILNRIGVDHVNFNLVTSGDSVATCTLNDLLLDPNLDYMLRVSELNAPMSSLPLFGYTSDGSTSVNEELFRIKKRVRGQTLAQFQALNTLVVPNTNETNPSNNPAGSFPSDVNTEGRGGVKYFAVTGFISDLGKSANNFSKKQDLIGANPVGVGAIPVIGIGSPPDVNGIPSNTDYLRIRLNGDVCVEFIGDSLFWNNFCIVFSEYGKQVLGIHSDFLRKVVKTQLVPGAPVIYEYIMSVTHLHPAGTLQYDMFFDYGLGLVVLDFTAGNYRPLDRNVKIISATPLFKNLEHRYFVSVETDLLVSQAIKVVDGKQTIDRSICKVYFPTQCKVLLESEDGILREDVDFEVENRIGQHSFVKKTEPSRQWTALQTSYDLRFYRFHLFVTYRYFKIPENKWIFAQMKYPIDKNDSWGIGLEFVSKI